MQFLSFIVKIELINFLEPLAYEKFVLAWTLFQSVLILIHFNIYSPIGAKYQGKLEDVEELNTDFVSLMFPLALVGLFVSLIYTFILRIFEISWSISILFGISLFLYGIMNLIQFIQRSIGQLALASFETAFIGFGRIILLLTLPLVLTWSLWTGSLIYLVPLGLGALITVIVFQILNQEISLSKQFFSFNIFISWIGSAKWVIVADLTVTFSYFYGAFLLSSVEDKSEIAIYDLSLTILAFVSLVFSNYAFALLLEAKNTNAKQVINNLISKLLIPTLTVSLLLAYLFDYFGWVNRLLDLVIRKEFTIDTVTLLILAIIPSIQTVSRVLISYSQGFDFFRETAISSTIGISVATIVFWFIPHSLDFSLIYLIIFHMLNIVILIPLIMRKLGD